MSEQPTPSAPTPSDLHRWVVAVTEHLGTDPDAMDVDLLLDLARDVAHTVARPAVPLTTFLAGYAVALGGGDRAALENVVGEVARMVERWPDVGADADVKAAGSSGGGAGDVDVDTAADSPSSQDVRDENAEWSGEGTA